MSKTMRLTEKASNKNCFILSDTMVFMPNEVLPKFLSYRYFVNSMIFVT